MHFYASTSFFDTIPPPQHPRGHEKSKLSQPVLYAERLIEPRIGKPPKVTPAPDETLPSILPRSSTPKPKGSRRTRHESSPPQLTTGRTEDPRLLGVHDAGQATEADPPVPIPLPTRVGPSGRLGRHIRANPSLSGQSTGSIGTAPLPSATMTSSSSSAGGGGGIVSGLLHKFGSKSRSSGRSTPITKSQISSPVILHGIQLVNIPLSSSQSITLSTDTSTDTLTEKPRTESIKSTPKKTRARATSLLGRLAKPFTPPASLAGDNAKDPPLIPKLASMRSLVSLRPNPPPRFSDSPPVPAFPAGIPRISSKSALSNLVQQHPLCTAAIPLDTPPHPTDENAALTIQMGGKYYKMTTTHTKSRPASLVSSPVPGLLDQHNTSPSSQPTPGGLAPPPRRPNMRKRPSTADPIVNRSGRLVISQNDEPRCL